MMRRAVEVFERAAATGVAAEGEGEATMWNDEDDDKDDKEVAAEVAAQAALSTEQELESFEAAAAATATTTAVSGGDASEDDDWSPTGDWSLDDADDGLQQRQVDGPACPVKGAVVQVEIGLTHELERRLVSNS